MGDKADREAELLLDLRLVLVAPDPVGQDVLEDGARVRARLRRAARSGDAGLRVDDDSGWVDRVGERRKREEGRGRIAAGVGDQAPARRSKLGQRVAPVGDLAGPWV